MAHPDDLTSREREVLDLVRLGLTNEEIAERLGVSVAGAKYHVSQILGKLGVGSRHEAAAVVLAERRRWRTFALAPLAWPLKQLSLPLVAKFAATAVLVAAAGGTAALVWAVVTTSGPGDQEMAFAPSPTSVEAVRALASDTPQPTASFAPQPTTVVLASPTTPVSVEPQFSDEDLLRVAYQGPKAPSGAYQEEASSYYVNTASVRSPSERTGWIELCSDDKEQAREWALLTHAYSDTPGTLVGERETNRFFEFSSADNSVEAGLSLMRVHKCSYFEATLDKLSPAYNFGGFSEAVLGIFRGPATLDGFREFAEYHWFSVSGNKNLFGSNMLASVAITEPDSLRIDLYTTGVAGGDWGVCDGVSLRKLTYRLDEATGEVLLRQGQVRSIPGPCHPNPF